MQRINKTKYLTRANLQYSREKIGKILLKKLRFWSKFQKNVTCWEAYCHLVDSPMPVSEREKLPRFESCHRHIEQYLTNYCGFKKTRKSRDFHIILERDAPTPAEKRINRNYFEMLVAMYEREYKI